MHNVFFRILSKIRLSLFTILGNNLHDFRQIENCFAKQTPRQQIETVLLLPRQKLYRKWVPFHESWVMMSFLRPPRLPMPTS